MSWICIDYFFSLFFPLAAKLIGPKTGCQFLKNVDFFDNGPLNQAQKIRPPSNQQNCQCLLMSCKTVAQNDREIDGKEMQKQW